MIKDLKNGKEEYKTECLNVLEVRAGCSPIKKGELKLIYDSPLSVTSEKLKHIMFLLEIKLLVFESKM